MSGGDRGPDLLASLPAERAGPEPAALEEVRSVLAGLRDEVAGLRRELAAERPAPATREELDAWGARLAGGMNAASGPKSADGAAVAAAADRLDAALVRAVERLSAEIGMMDRRLAATSMEGATEQLEGAAAGLGSATEQLEEAAKKMGATMGNDIRSANRLVGMLRDDFRGLRFGWRVFLAPWAIFVFVLGMALESRILLLYGWLWKD